jgi:hypothetical protein
MEPCPSLLIIADLSINSSDIAARRTRDPTPSLTSRARAAKDTVAELQTEKQALQSQLRYLQHHLSLSKLHAKYSNGTEGRNRRMDYEHFRLLGEQRKALVASHSGSVRGSHAREYQALLTKYIHLEDRFREITTARIVGRYRLQKLIIDAARSYTTPQMVSRHSCLRHSPPIPFFRLPNIVTLRLQVVGTPPHVSAGVITPTHHIFHLEPTVGAADTVAHPETPSQSQTSVRLGLHLPMLSVDPTLQVDVASAATTPYFSAFVRLSHRVRL